MISKLLMTTVTIGIIVLTNIICTNAQLMPRGENRKLALGIEYMRPEYGTGSFLTSYVLFANLWAKLSDKAILSIDVPFSHSHRDEYYDYYNDYYYGSSTRNAVGNLYAGISFGKINTGPFSEIGIRFPTAPIDQGGDAFMSGVLTDINRFEAFRIKSTAIQGAFGYNGITESGLATFFMIQPTFWFNDRTYYSKGSEFLLHYKANLWYDWKAGGYGAGFSGVSILSEDNLFYHGRTALQFDLGANFKLGTTRPGFQITLPITRDLDRLVDYTFSLNWMLGFK